ncbi:hypothetical protein JL720_14098 [Aureococcus anophagefferens]|nr:hypothetical protein JL720_14098 [Aureococcus anophagefferens]
MRSVHKLSPRTIATFVELLKAYKRKVFSAADVSRRIATLLHGYPDLIKDFDNFLPVHDAPDGAAPAPPAPPAADADRAPPQRRRRRRRRRAARVWDRYSDDAETFDAFAAAVLGACDGGGPPPQSFDAMVERRAVFRGEADDIVGAIAGKKMLDEGGPTKEAEIYALNAMRAARSEDDKLTKQLNDEVKSYEEAVKSIKAPRDVRRHAAETWHARRAPQQVRDLERGPAVEAARRLVGDEERGHEHGSAPRAARRRRHAAPLAAPDARGRDGLRPSVASSASPRARGRRATAVRGRAARSPGDAALAAGLNAMDFAVNNLYATTQGGQRGRHRR